MMANVLLVISVLISINSFVVDFSNSVLSPACSSSPNLSHMKFLDDSDCCGNYSFDNFSGTSSSITRCCCNVLPAGSLSPLGLAGPGSSLFHPHQYCCGVGLLAQYRSVYALPVDLLSSWFRFCC